MSTSLLECRYFGHNPNSFFVPGQVYTLLVKQCWWGIIKVTPCKNSDGEPYNDMDEQYRNLGEFFKQWQPTRCLQADINRVYFYAGGQA